jgi:hypothetical protein
MAEEGKLDPVVGREKEIERVCQILSRRKRTTLLIGEPGLENRYCRRFSYYTKEKYLESF